MNDSSQGSVEGESPPESLPAPQVPPRSRKASRDKLALTPATPRRSAPRAAPPPPPVSVATAPEEDASKEIIELAPREDITEKLISISVISAVSNVLTPEEDPSKEIKELAPFQDIMEQTISNSEMTSVSKVLTPEEEYGKEIKEIAPRGDSEDITEKTISNCQELTPLKVSKVLAPEEDATIRIESLSSSMMEITPTSCELERPSIEPEDLKPQVRDPGKNPTAVNYKKIISPNSSESEENTPGKTEFGSSVTLQAAISTLKDEVEISSEDADSKIYTENMPNVGLEPHVQETTPENTKVDSDTTLENTTGLRTTSPKLEVKKGRPPKIPPRPKHLSKRYGMMGYFTPKIPPQILNLSERLHIRTRHKGTSKTESLPPSLFLNETSNDNLTEHDSSPPKILPRRPPPPIKTENIVLATDNSMLEPLNTLETKNSILPANQVLKRPFSFQPPQTGNRILKRSKSDPISSRNTEETSVHSVATKPGNISSGKSIIREVLVTKNVPENSKKLNGVNRNLNNLVKNEGIFNPGFIDDDSSIKSYNNKNSINLNNHSNIHHNDEVILRRNGYSNPGFINDDINSNSLPSSQSSPNLSPKKVQRHFSPHTPPSSPRPPRKRNFSGLKGHVFLETDSPPLSPRPVRFNPSGGHHARLRRAAMVLRASRSVAALSPSFVRRQNSREYCCEDCRKTFTSNSSLVSQPHVLSSDPEESQVDPDGNLTPLGQRWHELHVSKARLQAVSNTSELFAAFAMIALVEMQINTPCTVPDIAWVLFSINTTVLVGLNILALTISTYILPNLHVVTRLHPSALLGESPHHKMRRFVTLAWTFSTFLGLMLFFVEIALISWVKFWDLAVAGAIASTAIVVPSLVAFVAVALYFYRHLEVPERAPARPDPGEAPGEAERPVAEGQARTAEQNADGSLTPRGLRWRSLHISLAKLEASCSTSELIAGFGQMAMVELQTNTPTNIPPWMFILLAVNTTVLVLVHVFALMISTYLLPSVEAIEHHRTSNLIDSSPHEKMRYFIELASAGSTVLGMFLFLFEVGILCWIKFWDFSFIGAVSSSAVIGVALVVFVGFAGHFYHTLVVHKCDVTSSDLEQLEVMKRELEEQEDDVSNMVIISCDVRTHDDKLV